MIYKPGDILYSSSIGMTVVVAPESGAWGLRMLVLSGEYPYFLGGLYNLYDAYGFTLISKASPLQKALWLGQYE